MENTTTMIAVSIAKLGSNIQTVSVAEWSTVMVSLRHAGYNLDEVETVKRNGSIVNMDTVLVNDDTILVSIGKIKWWTDEVLEADEGNLIKVSFTFEKENQATANQLAFLDTQSTFEIIKEVMCQNWVSMNNFKEIVDADGSSLTLGDKLQDGHAYKIIVCAKPNCGVKCDCE